MPDSRQIAAAVESVIRQEQRDNAADPLVVALLERVLNRCRAAIIESDAPKKKP